MLNTVDKVGMAIDGVGAASNPLSSAGVTSKSAMPVTSGSAYTPVPSGTTATRAVSGAPATGGASTQTGTPAAQTNQLYQFLGQDRATWGGNFMGQVALAQSLFGRTDQQALAQVQQLMSQNGWTAPVNTPPPAGAPDFSLASINAANTASASQSGQVAPAQRQTTPGVLPTQTVNPNAPITIGQGGAPQGGAQKGGGVMQAPVDPNAPLGGFDRSMFAIHSTNAAPGLRQAILDLQASPGNPLAGITPDAIIANLPNVTADEINMLTPEEQQQAIRIFQLAGLPVPAGVGTPAGTTTTSGTTTTTHGGGNGDYHGTQQKMTQLSPLQRTMLQQYMGQTMDQPLGIPTA